MYATAILYRALDRLSHDRITGHARRSIRISLRAYEVLRLANHARTLVLVVAWRGIRG